MHKNKNEMEHSMWHIYIEEEEENEWEQTYGLIV